MPQPFKGDYSTGPNLILERPEAAMALANVIANWALVEQEIETIYAFLMAKWGPIKPTESFVPHASGSNVNFPDFADNRH